MKTDLSHLPAQKQHELQLIVETITALAEVELIILFGSYARGDWVEDSYDEGHITYTYHSDFDLLVVTDLTRFRKSRAFWNKVEQKVHDHPAVKTWASLIVEDVRRVQDNLDKARYFYVDLYREGIVLYDAGRVELQPPGELDDAQRKKEAEEDFAFWYAGATGFLKQFRFARDQGELRIAAFELHQATERFYNAALLVHTGYKAKQHNIETLGRQVAAHDPRFLTVFPRATDDDKRRFKLLKNAYIDARYNRDYEISREDLEWLGERVEQLAKVTEQSCRERIASFG